MSEQPDRNPEETGKEEKTVVEEIELNSGELVDRVKQLVEEGNVRQLIIRKANGETLLIVPLTASMVAGGAMLVLAPHLAALGVLAAFFAKLKLEVVRVVDEKEKNDDKTQIEIE